MSLSKLQLLGWGIVIGAFSYLAILPFYLADIQEPWSDVLLYLGMFLLVLGVIIAQRGKRESPESSENPKERTARKG